MTAQATSADDIAYVTALVRAHDLPRYYSTLFAPPELRADLLALYGFAAEVARVPHQVKEPMLGELRLRWWSDALVEAVRRDGAGETPALRAAAGAVARHALPLPALEALIAAHGADLYSDPPATLTDLEGRMGETESALFQMAAIVSGAATEESADAAGHAGVAYGVARRLSRLASDRARGRTILPDALLTEHGLTASAAFASEVPANLPAAAAALAAFARRHLALAREHAVKLPTSARSVFLPLATVEPLLKRIQRLGLDIAERNTGISNLESLTRIGWARLRGQSGRG
jgi:15-cis-phytoene synthase